MRDREAGEVEEVRAVVPCAGVRPDAGRAHGERMRLDRAERIRRLGAHGPRPTEVTAVGAHDRGPVMGDVDAEVVEVILQLARGVRRRQVHQPDPSPVQALAVGRLVGDRHHGAIDGPDGAARRGRGRHPGQCVAGGATGANRR